MNREHALPANRRQLQFCAINPPRVPEESALALDRLSASCTARSRTTRLLVVDLPRAGLPVGDAIADRGLPHHSRAGKLATADPILRRVERVAKNISATRHQVQPRFRKVVWTRTDVPRASRKSRLLFRGARFFSGTGPASIAVRAVRARRKTFFRWHRRAPVPTSAE